jgi:hypothetical protein
MRAILLAGAALFATAAGASFNASHHERAHRSAVVVRAAAPISMGDRRGDATFHGACWKLAAGWSSDAEKGRVSFAVVVAQTCT